MKVIHVTPNTIPNMRKRLAADYVCWVGTTAALAYFSFPILGAIVGATGIMYLRWATKEYFTRKRVVNVFLEAMAQLAAQDDPFDGDDWPNP